LFARDTLVFQRFKLLPRCYFTNAPRRSRSTFCIALRGWIELADLSAVAEVDANQSPKAEE